MRLGIATYGFNPAHIVPLARHAEALGFHGIWLGEHILEPKEFESVHPHDEGKAFVPVHTRIVCAVRRLFAGVATVRRIVPPSSQ